MKNKKILVVIVSIMMLFCLNGCNISKEENDNVVENNVEENISSIISGNVEENNSDVIDGKDINRYANIEQNPTAVIEMENGGIIKLELYPKIAPESVENFIELASGEFYNGLNFHRVIPGFMIQGGGPNDGTENLDYSIYGEFSSNGFENSLKHTRGILSMARSEDKNSAGSQFFIMVDEAPHLDGEYAAFGKVLEGMDVVDAIVKSEVIRTDYSDEFKEEVNKAGGEINTLELYTKYIEETMELDRPVNPPIIKSITVDTYGVTYASPTKIELQNM